MLDYSPNQWGVITREAIPAGRRVLEMHRRFVRTFTPEEWENIWPAEGNKHNAAIDHCGVIYTNWTATGRMPTWYHLNHSFEPNLKIRMRNGRIVWMTKRAIRAGKQLTFDYGDAPADWI